MMEWRTDARYREAFERLCKAVADPARTCVTVRAQDLRLVLTEVMLKQVKPPTRMALSTLAVYLVLAVIVVVMVKG